MIDLLWLLKKIGSAKSTFEWLAAKDIWIQKQRNKKSKIDMEDNRLKDILKNQQEMIILLSKLDEMSRKLGYLNKNISRLIDIIDRQKP